MREASRCKLFLVLGLLATLTAAFVGVELYNRVSISEARKTSSLILDDVHQLVPEDGKQVERVEFNVARLNGMVKRADQAQVRVAISTAGVLMTLALIFFVLAYQEKRIATTVSPKT